MAWQMLVIVAQLGIGAGLLLGGLRRVAVFWLVGRNADYSDYLAKRLGRPLPRSTRTIALGLLMMLAGGLMVATIDMTAQALRPAQPY